MAKLGIVVLVLAFLNGIRTFDAAFLLPQLVGMGVNLSIVASLVWVVHSLQKRIHG